MAEAPVELLQRVPLFADFESGELERLARSFKERTFEAGSNVVDEGKTGAGFFVIESGEASVSVHGGERDKLGPGDYFGEIALIDEGARSATVTADSELRCWGLTSWEFRPLVEGNAANRVEAPRDDGQAAARRAELIAHEVSDAALVARCRTGDDDAWRELVDRFSRYVYAIAVQGFRLGQQDAEDVFQDVFARVYERLGSLRDDDAVRPWIAQLTRRVCIDRLRSGARESDADLEDAARAARRGHADRARGGLRRARGDGRAARELPGRSSTASSPGTRATGRSATRSDCPPGRSPAASPAASTSFVTPSREEILRPPRPVDR